MIEMRALDATYVITHQLPIYKGVLSVQHGRFVGKTSGSLSAGKILSVSFQNWLHA